MKRIMALAAIALVAAGCTESRENAGAGIMDQVTGTAFGPKPYQAADFVVRSRRGDRPFMAVGVSAPDRRLRPKTPAEQAAMEARLSAAARQQQRVGATTAAEGQRVRAAQPRPPKVE